MTIGMLWNNKFLCRNNRYILVSHFPAPRHSFAQQIFLFICSRRQARSGDESGVGLHETLELDVGKGNKDVAFARHLSNGNLINNSLFLSCRVACFRFSYVLPVPLNSFPNLHMYSSSPAMFWKPELRGRFCYMFVTSSNKELQMTCIWTPVQWIINHFIT